MILNISDKYNYPSLLKNITDNLVINKNFILSANCFTKYIHILSMFKETEEYVMNLIDSSFSDFKLPIKAEFYDYLIFRSILESEIQKIKTFIDTLNKRYAIDYTNEKTKKSENHKGNLFLIESIINAIKDLNSTNKDSKYNYESININFEELYKVVNDLIKSSKEENNSWMFDEKFIKITCNYYSSLCFNPDELKILLDEISKNTKINIVVLKDIVNDIFKTIQSKIFDYLKENKDALVRKCLYLLSNLIKYHSSKLSVESKEEITKEENLRKIFNFIKNNSTTENKESIKVFITVIVELKKDDTLNSVEMDMMRRLANSVFEDRKDVASLFGEFYSKREY